MESAQGGIPSSTSFWTIQNPSESLSKTYSLYYKWDTVFSSRHWLVQKRAPNEHPESDFVILSGASSTLSDTLPEPRFMKKPIYNPSLACGCLQVDCVICNELPYRLCVAIGKQILVIAQASKRKHIIENNLQYLQHNVSPMLEIMESEERLKASLTHPSNNPKSQQSQNILLEFVILKIRALVQEQQTTPLPQDPESHFRQQFPTLTSEIIQFRKFHSTQITKSEEKE
jgi:hypothetical protein